MRKLLSLLAAVCLLTLVASQGLPYSPVVEANGVLYFAGKNGRNPETCQLPGNIEDETHFTLEAAKGKLEGVVATMANVVRCQGFLANTYDFDAMNSVYRTYFLWTPPARTTVAAKDIVIAAKIEIELPAVLRYAEKAL